MLRKIFGPKRDKIIGERRRLHNKKLYALYFSPDIIPVIKTGHVEHMGEERYMKGFSGET